MPDIPVSPELLDDLLEGRVSATGAGPEVAALAELAGFVGVLQVAGPSLEARTRMRGQLGEVLDGGPPRWWQWPAVAPLRERLAAGILVAGLLGGGASYATGVSPVEAASGAADLARSVVVNLNPNRDSGDPAAGPSATPEPSPTAPTATISPEATPPPPSATPDSTSGGPDDGDDDESREDNSGRGSENSGRDDDDETKTPEPGDDN